MAIKCLMVQGRQENYEEYPCGRGHSFEVVLAIGHINPDGPSIITNDGHVSLNAQGAYFNGLINRSADFGPREDDVHEMKNGFPLSTTYVDAEEIKKAGIEFAGLHDKGMRFVAIGEDVVRHFMSGVEASGRHTAEDIGRVVAMITEKFDAVVSAGATVG